MEHVMAIKRKKTSLLQLPVKNLQAAIQSDLAIAAGDSKLRERDPVYELTESFRARFDSFPQRAAGMSLDGEQKSVQHEATKSHTDQKERQRTQTSESSSLSSAQGYARDQDFNNRFVQLAFNNGKMSGAILHGTEKEMFVSCLQRAGGVSFLPDQKQKRLDAASAEVPVQNYGTRLRFNRWTHGAAGLVLDALMDTNRVLSLLETLASGRGGDSIEGNNVDIYRRLFPFLSIKHEQEMLAYYEDALKTLSQGGVSQDPLDIDKKAVLTQGVLKTRAVIDRKMQMKDDFMVILRKVMERSREVKTYFSSPASMNQAAAETFGSVEEDDDDNDRDQNRNPNVTNPQRI